LNIFWLTTARGRKRRGKGLLFTTSFDVPSNTEKKGEKPRLAGGRGGKREKRPREEA